MKIIVLVKQVPDTWSDRSLDLTTGRVLRNPADAVVDEIDERALEIALAYQDANEAEVVALSMGPAAATDALRKFLATGADSALHVLDETLGGADASRTAAVLAAAIRRVGFDLVIAGAESTDGRGGAVPAMVAEHLGVPHLTGLDSAAVTADAVSGERTSDAGVAFAHVALPAVISVTERSAEPRFPNFKGIMRAKKKPLDVVTVAELGLDPSFPGVGRSRVTSVVRKPARTGGTKVVDQGDAGVQLAEFLAAGRLI